MNGRDSATTVQKGITKNLIKQCHFNMTERNKQMEAITSVKINVDALKAAFKKAGRTYAEANRMLGLTTNRISSCMFQGSMRQDELERICMLLNVKFEDMKAKEPEKPKEQKEPVAKAGGGSIRTGYVIRRNKCFKADCFIYSRPWENPDGLVAGD